MKLLVYLAGVPAVVWAALHVSALFAPSGSSPLARQTLPELLRSLHEERARKRELDTHSRAMFRCLVEKDEIARQVCAGRLDLLEAAARFRDLQNAVPSYHWAEFRACRPGDTDEEKLCVAVLDLVTVFAADLSSGGAALLDRLGAELKLHRRRGTLRLRPARRPEARPDHSELRIVQ